MCVCACVSKTGGEVVGEGPVTAQMGGSSGSGSEYRRMYIYSSCNSSSCRGIVIM